MLLMNGSPSRDQKFYYNFMHQSSQRKITFSLSGDGNPEERLFPRQFQLRDKRGGREEEAWSLLSSHPLKGSRMYKSTSLCHPGLTRANRGSRPNPENGMHSHETSECSYKVKTQPHHQPPSANNIEQAALNKKRNHFLTVVSRLPTNRHKLKL